jgi:hypothetical protein
MLILVTSILLISISSSLSTANAVTIYQEPVLLQWYLNRAQNYLVNSKDSLSGYSGILNVTTKLSIYADMVNASDQMSQAIGESQDPSQLNVSLESGRISMFLAIRSYYRIALAVAFAHILNAEQEINTTPSYVPPSPEANDSLRQAEFAYEPCYYPGYLEYSVVYPGYYYWVVDAADVNVTTTNMVSATEALLFGPNSSMPSVVAMADSARNEAELWNATQEPLARSQLLERISAVKTSFLYSVLPTMGTLLLAMIFVVIKLLSGVLVWAKTIRLPPKWKGQLDYRSGMLLVNAILVGGGFQLANAISQLSSYQSGSDFSFLIALALIGSGFGATSVAFILLNSPKKPRRSRAILAVTFFVLTIVVYLVVTWTLAPIFLRPGQV